MDEIRELIQNLASLSAEDLDTLRSKIEAEFARLDKEATTAEVVAAQNQLADYAEQVQAQSAEREAAQAQAETDRQAARDRIAALKGEPADETDETATAEGDDTAGEGEEVDDQAAVAASGKPAGGKAARMARRTPPKPSPEAAPQDARTSLVAAGSLYGTQPGTALDKRTLADSMSRALSRMGQPTGPRGSSGTDVIVASANWASQYPEDRKISGDFETDQRRWKDAFDADALVATGGICAPVNVDWTINTIATADRPLREAFPAYEASRGGLIYRPDLDFAALSGATGIWTEATDAAPAGATKPILTIQCPSTETVYVEAVSTRLGFGNMQSRFDPETVAANTDMAMAAYARVADNNLLNLVAAQCTQGVTTSQVLGATRDLLTSLGQCVAAFRNLHRVPRSQALRAIFPDWFKELLRIDLARETAHQQDGQWNSLMITDEQIEALFAPYGVNPIWHLDGQATSAPGLSGAVNQYFTTQSTGAINTFPTKVAWYLFYEGAFQLLDGGRLDLGVVRDSLLDSTNDYETFVEVFETLAYRGFTGGAIQLISTLCANGGSAGTINTSASCA